MIINKQTLPFDAPHASSSTPKQPSFWRRLLPESIRNLLTTILTAYLILGISGVIIAYGRGYRLNVKEKSVGTTGMLTTTSNPNGAFVIINGKKYGATSTNITLPPDWYDVRIEKEGYQPWGKKLRVQGEILARADPVLFPKNPSLTAISTEGVGNPVLSPDGTKLAFTVLPPPEATISGLPAGTKAGLYVIDLVDKPLGINRDARQIVSTLTLDTSRANISWSPDNVSLLIEVTNPTTGLPLTYLVDSNRLNQIVPPVQSKETLLATWKKEQATIDEEKLAPLAPEFISIATDSMHIMAFSPDELKILYEATASATLPIIITPRVIGTNPTPENRDLIKDHIYVYDLKEDRNYDLGDAKKYGIIAHQTYPSPTPTSKSKRPSTDLVLEAPPTPVNQSQGGWMPVQWLSTSNHLVVTAPGHIDIMEYDGGNRVTVYAGPFESGFVAPWTNGSKLVVMTNLNPSASVDPNLYAVNIR